MDGEWWMGKMNGDDGIDGKGAGEKSIGSSSDALRVCFQTSIS